MRTMKMCAYIERFRSCRHSASYYIICEQLSCLQSGYVYFPTLYLTLNTAHSTDVHLRRLHSSQKCMLRPHTHKRTHTVYTSSFYSILESHLFVLFSLYFSIHSHSFILNHSLPQCECTYACQSPCKIALIIVHTICWVVLFFENEMDFISVCVLCMLLPLHTHPFVSLFLKHRSMYV